jgi:hypothetical protein
MPLWRPDAATTTATPNSRQSRRHELQHVSSTPQSGGDIAHLLDQAALVIGYRDEAVVHVETSRPLVDGVDHDDARSRELARGNGTFERVPE